MMPNNLYRSAPAPLCAACPKKAQHGMDFCADCATKRLMRERRQSETLVGVASAANPIIVSGGDAPFLADANLDAFPVNVSRACTVPGCPFVAALSRGREIGNGVLCVGCAKKQAQTKRSRIAGKVSDGAGVGLCIVFLTCVGSPFLVYLALMAPFALVWGVARLIANPAQGGRTRGK